MNTIVLVRIAKLVALFAFVLPWATISCSGQELVTLSGVDLITGRLEFNGQTENMGIGWAFVIALALIGIGLVMAFGNRSPKGPLVCAIAALILIIGGMMWFKGSPAREARQGGQYSGMSAVVRIEEKYGYFFALLSLIGAAALSGMALRGTQRLELPREAQGALGSFGAALRGRDDDVADWDRVADKDNPDQLQEYLLRHPNGRFAELARMKLQRMGVEPMQHQEPARQSSPAASQPTPESYASSAEARAGRDEVHTYEPEPARARVPGGGAMRIILVAVAALMLMGGAGGGYLWWRQQQERQAADAARLAWEGVSRSDPAALRAYLSNAPEQYRDDVQAALAVLEADRYAAAMTANTEESYRQFLADFPSSARASVIRSRLDELVALNALTAPIVGLWTGVVTPQSAGLELLVAFAIAGESVRGEWEIAGVCRGVWDAGSGSARRGAPWSFTTAEHEGGCSWPAQIHVDVRPDGGLDVLGDPTGGQQGAAPIVLAMLTRVETP